MIDDLQGDANMEGMIQNMELAFRMQSIRPQLLDLSKETQWTMDGWNHHGDIHGNLCGTAPIKSHGREHQPESFCAWMAGGVKGGFTWGETDHMGYNVSSGKVHIHDLHATMLHLLGIHHTQLTFNQVDRDFRLTDAHSSVVKEILA